MKGIRVNPASRRARAEPGLRRSEFDRETRAWQLSTTGGTVSGTRIGGLTLSSGFGWLQGKPGLTVDSLLGAVLEQECEMWNRSRKWVVPLAW